MDTDFIMLQARFDALRTYFLSLLPTIFEHGSEKDSKVWLAKYLLWQHEREFLSPFSFADTHGSLDQDRINRRLFQLQVLMDVAYIQGRLEEYGILRKVDSYAAAQALKVFDNSDKTEETMIPLIDALDDD